MKHGSMADIQRQSFLLAKDNVRTIRLVFLTVFLDLVGFSIVFPLFPAMMRFYFETCPDDPLLKTLGNLLEIVSPGGLQPGFATVVLFGGILGSLYSATQFVASPFWGSLSDRIGRRPILLLSTMGIVVGYLIWGFAKSFSLLVISRLLCGAMSGNISAATAAIADITPREKRSSGMATIGIAFGLGFIFGPAIGGILATIDLSKIHSGTISYGINPFSVPAFFAVILGLSNFFLLLKIMPETNRSRRISENGQIRTANPLQLLKPLPLPGVNRINIGYFLYIAAFSGMEFTLTFLAVERFDYSPLENAAMFVFTGVMIGIVQGVAVRRYAHRIGERQMSLIGLIVTIPGLMVIASAQNWVSLFCGLALLATGSGLATPCLTSLVSLLTPVDLQGRVLGTFRSLGALARVVGPLGASFCYWTYGSASPYLIAGISLFIPLVLIRSIKMERVQ